MSQRRSSHSSSSARSSVGEARVGFIAACLCAILPGVILACAEQSDGLDDGVDDDDTSATSNSGPSSTGTNSTSTKASSSVGSNTTANSVTAQVVTVTAASTGTMTPACDPLMCFQCFIAQPGDIIECNGQMCVCQEPIGSIGSFGIGGAFPSGGFGGGGIGGGI